MLRPRLAIVVFFLTSGLSSYRMSYRPPTGPASSPSSGGGGSRSGSYGGGSSYGGSSYGGSSYRGGSSGVYYSPSGYGGAPDSAPAPAREPVYHLVSEGHVVRYKYSRYNGYHHYFYGFPVVYHPVHFGYDGVHPYYLVGYGAPRGGYVRPEGDGKTNKFQRLTCSYVPEPIIVNGTLRLNPRYDGKPVQHHCDGGSICCGQTCCSPNDAVHHTSKIYLLITLIYAAAG